MPPALDRLLASPSALRLLRSIVNTPDLPAAFSTAAKCCTRLPSRHEYYKERKSPSPSKPKSWRWNEPNFIIPDLGAASQGIGKDHDDATWAADLARRERLSQLPGIRAVWKILRTRKHRLPTDETSDANFLWGTFIKDPELIEHVIDHAAELRRNTGTIYPRLYDLVMTYWLPRDPRVALDAHHQMLVKLNLRKLPLRELARLLRNTFRPEGWEALMDIYRNSNERDLYQETVIPLIEYGNIPMARRWHTLCTFRGDAPSESAASHPVIRVLMAETSIISNTEARFKTRRMSKKSKRDARRYNYELMQRLLGRDTAPVRFEDSFCARMFATKSFPPASIIQGLAMVGVNEIGPQALLAMALRTFPVDELPKRFEELKAAGIALQGCVFSLALEKFVLEQKWQLVRSMLDSDQHPDVFGHTEVQRGLLEYYLDHRDFVQAQRTLAILTLFHNDSSTESWNLLLQVYIKRSGPQHVMEVLQDMQSRNVMVSAESILAIKGLLRRRYSGRKPFLPRQDGFDDLRFVTRVFMSILESGMGYINPLTWREIILRFGMLGRFRELRRLLLWLLCWYAPRSRRQFDGLPKSPFLDSATAKLRAAHPGTNHYFCFPATVLQSQNPLHPIRQLFKPSLQQAIITWGFRAALLPNAHLEQSLFGPTLEKKHYRDRLFRNQILTRPDWTIGLHTVVLLRRLGVRVYSHAVIRALQLQFIVLFGGGRSNKKRNRAMEQANTIPYMEYIREVNKIWGIKLFGESQILGTGTPHDLVWHPRLAKNTNRRTQIALSELLGPDWRKHINGRNPESGDRKPQSSDPAAIKDLQQYFLDQTKASDPEFDLISKNRQD
ncbi:Nn.00g106280.m01.CDS01 [Neocucurbitaria sp. VM-36]